ncbi:hypothetical protein O1L55_40960 [Streptomyces albulus]|nr:hypothetical protein [Streptomyces noursei]
MSMDVFLVAGYCLMSLGNVMEHHGARAVESAQRGSLEYVIGVRPQFVRADFAKTDGAPQNADGPMLYLGQAGGIQVLYDCATREVVRKPSTQVQLTSPIGSGRDRVAREVQATRHRQTASATSSR